MREETKKEFQKHTLVLELILEILETWAETEGISLISSQQLHSPSAERNEKVRMLLQKIRELG
jgi:hypothetical protein